MKFKNKTIIATGGGNGMRREPVFNLLQKGNSLFLPVLLSILFLGACKETSKTTSTATYKTMQVSLGEATVSQRYPVSIKGKQYVEIRPQVSGLITEIRIDEGAAVRKGQHLFVIDQVPYRAALETAVANAASAEAKVATAQLAVNSKQALYDGNVISEYELQTAKNSLLEAKAVLAQARAGETNAHNNLSYTVVKSPVDGVAGMIPYRVGALVSSAISEPLVMVSSEDEMYAYFSMTESQLLELAGENCSLAGVINSLPPVKLALSNGNLYEQEGRIDAISGSVDSRTGAISIRAGFANPKRLLRNGGAATVVIPYHKRDCIVIPKSATFEIQDRVYIYKVVDGKAVSAEISTFKVNNGTEYIVESGLSAGDIIIAEGAGLVREGTAIQTTQNEGAL